MESLGSAVDKLKHKMALAPSTSPDMASSSGSPKAATAVGSKRPLSSVKSAKTSSGSGTLPSADALARQKQENLQRQALLRQSLTAKHTALLEEQKRLALVNDELKELEVAHAKDVEKLREMIETVSLELSSKSRTFEIKKREYFAVKKEVDELSEKRTKLTEHLTQIIVNNEQRKAEKLASIMAKLKAMDGRSAMAAAPTAAESKAPVSAVSKATVVPSVKGPAIEEPPAFGGFPDD